MLQAITANQVGTIHFHINFMKLKVNYTTKWSGGGVGKIIHEESYCLKHICFAGE